jgi:hypothetical protein
VAAFAQGIGIKLSNPGVFSKFERLVKTRIVMW